MSANHPRATRSRVGMHLLWTVPSRTVLVLIALAGVLVLPTFSAAQNYDAYSLAKSSSGYDGSLVDAVRLFEVDVTQGVGNELGILSLGNFTSAQMAQDATTGALVALLDHGSNPRIAMIDPDMLRVLSVVAVAPPVACLAADPFSGDLIVAHGSSVPDRLGRLNPLTGVIQDLGAITFAGGPAALDLMAFAPNGQLCGLQWDKSSQNMKLWRIDSATRQAVLVGSTPAQVKQFDDAHFEGDALWLLRSSDNQAVQLDLNDASVLATQIFPNPKLYGLAGKGCVVSAPALMAADQPGDSGGAIALDWTGYSAPANLVRFDIVRTLNACNLLSGAATRVGSVFPGELQTFLDTNVENFTAYYYGIQVVVLDAGNEQVLEQLGSNRAAAFPNVVINEFAPAGGVAKSGGHATIQVGEFVELFNLAPDPIDLTGWLLSNGKETEPLTGIIPGNGLLVHTVAVIDLPDAGGLFQLLPPDASSFVIDDVAYGSEGGAPTAPSGFTISRVDGTDSTTPDEDAFSISSPTPNAANVVAPPNLGGSLVLNEVYYQGGIGQDYVELFNPTGGTIALREFALSDGFGFVDTLDTNLDVRPGGWFVLNSQSQDPFRQDLVTTQLYLYKITESGLLELVDHLGWGPGDGDPQPPQPDAVNTTLVRNADGDALYLGDIGTNWIECGGDITLFYGPPSPGGPNVSPQLPTLLVDPSGNGDFIKITDALNAAQAGTRILVSPGTYEERFNLKDGVSIYGIGSLPAEVIIAGPGGHTPIQAFGVGSTTEVSRVSIRGGYAAADGPFAQTPASGGGLRVVSGSPVFKNVRFEYNIANNNGGAVAIAGGTPLFEGCQFLNNFANEAGGAIWVAAGNPTFRSCLFVGNKSGTDGGVVLMDGGTLDLEQCVLDKNVTAGQGMVFANGGTTVIEYSMISNSYAVGVEGETFGDAMVAAGTGAIQFGCGLLYNSSGPAAKAGVQTPDTIAGSVTLWSVVYGDPLYCQPLAFNYAYPNSSPVMQLATSCDKTIGVSGSPCGQTLTDAEATPAARTTLYPPAPNPFNPSVVLRFDLATPGQTELVVYDVRGRRVVELLRGAPLGVGPHQVEWHGQDAFGRALGSGIYFARLRVNGVDVGGIRKMVLLK